METARLGVILDSSTLIEAERLHFDVGRYSSDFPSQAILRN